MTFLPITGIFLITVLSMPNSKAHGEPFISNSDKDQKVKTYVKRLENFRVPVETPFDPNFWPTRGRRSKQEAETLRPNEICTTDENGNYEKNGIRCFDASYQGQNNKQVPITEGFKAKGMEETENYNNYLNRKRPDEEIYGCSEAIWRVLQFLSEQCYDPFKVKSMEMSKTYPHLDLKKHKKLRYIDLPEVNWQQVKNIVFRQDLPEKEKKEDVFWVARGKRTRV